MRSTSQIAISDVERNDWGGEDPSPIQVALKELFEEKDKENGK